MERLTKYFSWLAGILIVSVLVYILGDIVKVSLLNFHWDFLVQSPFSAGRKGGIFPIILSTFWLLLVCLVVVILVGTPSALFLSEYKGNKNIHWIKRSIEVLASVPSIVFGLFGNAIFSVYLGFGFSILSGGLTLAIMALPLYIATLEKGFSSLPLKFRWVSASLGLSQFTLVKSVVIPHALSAIVVGIVLSVGRALSETAALIFTSGYVDRVPQSLFDSGRALSVHIYDLTMNVPGGDTSAYKSALVLITMILIINGVIHRILTSWHRTRIEV